MKLLLLAVQGSRKQPSSRDRFAASPNKRCPGLLHDRRVARRPQRHPHATHRRLHRGGAGRDRAGGRECPRQVRHHRQYRWRSQFPAGDLLRPGCKRHAQSLESSLLAKNLLCLCQSWARHCGWRTRMLLHKALANNASRDTPTLREDLGLAVRRRLQRICMMKAD